MYLKLNLSLGCDTSLVRGGEHSSHVRVLWLLLLCFCWSLTLCHCLSQCVCVCVVGGNKESIWVFRFHFIIKFVKLLVIWSWCLLLLLLFWLVSSLRPLILVGKWAYCRAPRMSFKSLKTSRGGKCEEVKEWKHSHLQQETRSYSSRKWMKIR